MATHSSLATKNSLANEIISSATQIHWATLPIWTTEISLASQISNAIQKFMNCTKSFGWQLKIKEVETKYL